MLQCHQCRKVLRTDEGGHRRVMKTGQDYSRTVNLCPRCAGQLQRSDRSSRVLKVVLAGAAMLLLVALAVYLLYFR
jgi:hypothetical protein